MPGKDTLATLKRRFYLTLTIIGVVILMVGTIWVFRQIWTPMSIIIVSAFLVFILRTPVAFLERKGVPRILGTAIMYVVTLLVIAAICLIFLPVVIEQVVGFLGMVPQYLHDAGDVLTQAFSEINDYLEESGIQNVLATVSGEVAKWATSLASNSASAMFATASSIGNSLLVAGVSLIVGFWVLKDLPRFGKELYKLVGPKYHEDVQVIGNACSRALGGYLRGMVVSCLCTGTLAFIAYSVIGIQYPLVMALFTGLMVFIPFIGPTTAWILAGLIGLMYSPLIAILAAALTIASQLINDNLIQPRVMGGNVNLHPAMILVVIFIGFALGGIFGMICAIPLAAATKAIFVYYFEKRTGRQLVSEKGALFKGHPSPHTDPVVDSSDGQLSARLVSIFSRKKKEEAPGNQSEQSDVPLEENNQEEI
ncbi:MAG: AI-2E family transporter [Coriobacteriales bacterium]|nr:AI-2E family transporter [Coriobacteriales bacterium]